MQARGFCGFGVFIFCLFGFFEGLLFTHLLCKREMSVLGGKIKLARHEVPSDSKVFFFSSHLFLSS